MGWFWKKDVNASEDEEKPPKDNRKVSIDKKWRKRTKKGKDIRKALRKTKLENETEKEKENRKALRNAEKIMEAKTKGNGDEVKPFFTDFTLSYDYNLEQTQTKISKAKKHEKLLEFKEAATIYKELGMDDEVIRIREAARNKVEQTVVQGDQITKTEIKDSVLNRSNVGGGSSKMQELKDLTEMKKEGLIDDAEFKQMKKEILGK